MNLIEQMIKNEKKNESIESLDEKFDKYGMCFGEYEDEEKVHSYKQEEIINCKNKYDISIDEYMGKEKPPEDENIVIITDGGIGDIICSTPMIESMRNTYKNKKIIVASFYPEIYFNNPNIDHLYGTRNSGDFYEKWVKNIRYNSSLFKYDIYNTGIHKTFPGKLSELFCHCYNVKYPGDNLKVYLTEDEEQESKKFLGSFPKEVILIHPSGAHMNYNQNTKLTPNKDWFNDYWKKLVSMLNKEFDIVQVGGKNEDMIEGVTTYLMGMTNIRQTMALVKNSLTFISIDSCVGHIGSAVKKSGIVLFGRSNPFIFGHNSNINIWIENSCEFNDLGCGRPQGNFLDSEMFKGMTRPWECPNKSCMRSITPELVYEKVFEAINKK